jgi:hypothetical protein
VGFRKHICIRGREAWRRPDVLRWRLPQLQPRAHLVVTGVIRAVDDRCPSLVGSGGSPPASEFERSGSIDELLGEVKHLVGLTRLAVETDADLSRDLVPIAWRPDVNRGNFAGP